MGKVIDLTGQKFNRLEVLEFAGIKKHAAYWRCRCECGNVIVVPGDSLRHGHTKSCGCLKREKFTNKKHGMHGTGIYSTWENMLSRCENPRSTFFDHYGGRGVKVCERWHIFQNFYDDVSKLPHFNEKGYTLDRIDNNGDYCPSNVRWTDKKTQVRNRRNNVIVEYQGVEMCLMEAAEKSGINYGTLHSRYYRDGKRGADLFKTANKRSD